MSDDASDAADETDSSPATDETDDPSDAPEEVIQPDPDALDADELQYPTFTFPEGTVARDGAFDLSRERDHEEMAAWLRDLAGALDSHDLAVEGDDRRATLGIGPEAVEMAFDPDEGHKGTFEVTVRFRAKLMDCVDADATKVGARGGRGFVPVEMLTGDRDPGEFRCYNWIEDPTADE
jgi:hypothetical protein